MKGIVAEALIESMMSVQEPFSKNTVSPFSRQVATAVKLRAGLSNLSLSKGSSIPLSSVRKPTSRMLPEFSSAFGPIYLLSCL